MEWTPKTKLGKLVQQGKITTMSDAFKTRLQLREPEIVDILLPDMEDNVLDVNMVQRMTDSGRRVKFSVTCVVGNNDGFVGLARLKGKDVDFNDYMLENQKGMIDSYKQTYGKVPKFELVGLETLEKWSGKKGNPFKKDFVSFLTSAKTGDNVEKAFYVLSKQILGEPLEEEDLEEEPVEEEMEADLEDMLEDGTGQEERPARAEVGSDVPTLTDDALLQELLGKPKEKEKKPKKAREKKEKPISKVAKIVLLGDKGGYESIQFRWKPTLEQDLAGRLANTWPEPLSKVRKWSCWKIFSKFASCRINWVVLRGGVIK